MRIPCSRGSYFICIDFISMYIFFFLIMRRLWWGIDIVFLDTARESHDFLLSAFGYLFLILDWSHLFILLGLCMYIACHRGILSLVVNMTMYASTLR
jgi:hypothetical protein